MQTGLRAKRVLITGASGGIGRACAELLAEEGARLGLHGHSNMARIDQLSTELETETIALQADLRSEGETERMFEKVKRELGGLDALVANAGIWPSESVSIKDMSLKRWQNTMETDGTSVFLSAREFFRILEESGAKGGSLIIVGSTAAVFGEEGHSDYAAAKAAITYGLTRSLKNEIVRIAPKGRVNAVCPGWTKTPMAEADLEEEETVRDVLSTRSLKEVASPKDIAGMVLFLASERLSGHVTGEVITVAGGMEGRLLHGREGIDPSSV